jgi:hypothetical protein
VKRERAGDPISLVLLRAELFKRLHSSGGRPALKGVSRRVKIPVSEQEWQKLEKLAASISEAGFTPSAGQVASVLLALSLRSVTETEPQLIKEQVKERVSADTDSDP